MKLASLIGFAMSGCSGGRAARKFVRPAADTAASTPALPIAPLLLLADALRHDFLHGVHVFGSSIDMNRGVRGVFGNFLISKRAATENAFQNFFYAKGETVGFGHAFDLRFAITRAQNGGELAEPVNALVVHLDHDDAFEFRKDFFETVREWMDVPQMQRPDFFAVFARAFRSVMN